MSKTLRVAFSTIMTIAVGVTSTVAQDCQPNGILDECDLDCALPGCSVPGCGNSFDCNGNTIPDECEALGQVVVWTGAAGDLSWSNPANWCPPIVPNDGIVSVIIAAPFQVAIDIPVSIGSLTLEVGGSLDVSGGDLSVIGPDGMLVRGAVTISNNRTIDVAGDLVIASMGSLGPPTGGLPTDASVVRAGNITIFESNPGELAGRLTLRGAMTVFSRGRFVMDGTNVPPLPTFPMASAVAGGDTPPLLVIKDAASLDIAAEMSLITSADILIGTPTPSPPGPAAGPGRATLRIGGDFDNRSIDPARFDATGGLLILDGVAPQVFEVASPNLATTCVALQAPFLFDEIQIASTANVTFVDQFDNDGAGQSNAEVQAVRTFVMASGASIVVDAAGVIVENFSGTQSSSITLVNGGTFTTIQSLCVPIADHWAVLSLLIVMLCGATVALRRRRSTSHQHGA